LKKDLGKIFRKLEQLLEQQIKKQLEPEDKTITLSDQDKAEALKLLQDPKLLERVNADLETCGLVGENINKLVAFLAAVSRKLAKPLAVLVQSSSAAGKSALMDAVLAFCPAEERVQYSAMTGQSLFYMGETDLKHKVLAIAEEKGAERASYPLKLLQSEGELTIASTGKDPKSGRLTTHEYHVEGPTAILLTTTAIDLDEELQNRCMVLAVDESREQTRAIHQMQRESRTLEGLELRFARSDLLKLHQNAQRLLRPLYVVNQYSPRLTFLESTTRTRRDHLKYLGLIEAIALVHQHQRPVKTGVLRGRKIDYIETTVADIALANQLAAEVLGRTLDELPPQTRGLLFAVEELVKAECTEREILRSDYRFSRRQIREYTGTGNTQLRLHLDRLVEMEYLLVHRGSRGQSFVYELLYDGEGKQGESFVLGLTLIEKLNNPNWQPQNGNYDANLAGSKANLAGPKRAQNAPKTGGWRGGANADTEEDNPTFQQNPKNNAYTGSKKPAPYRSGVAVTAKSRNDE
jgi:DNA primase